MASELNVGGLTTTGSVGVGTSPTAIANYTALTVSGAYGGVIDLKNGSIEDLRLLSQSTQSFVGTQSATPLILRTAGAEAMRIDSTGNSTFSGDVTATTTAGADLRLSTSAASVTDTDNIGKITWNAPSESSGTNASIVAGEIALIADGGWDSVRYTPSILTFKTTPVNGTAMVEAMRIDSAGNVGIGTSSPTQALEVNAGTTNNVAHFESTDSTARVTISDNSTSGIGYVYVAASSNDLLLGAGNSSRVTIAGSTGIATFSAGIAFSSQTDASGTGIASGATTLDHYEVGTWTPILKKGTSAALGITAYGYYTRVGNLVWLSFYTYQTGSTETTSGVWTITGLPFPLPGGVVTGYNSLPGAYVVINGTWMTAPSRWQVNSAGSALTLYGTDRQLDWNSGALEFSASGVVTVLAI